MKSCTLATVAFPGSHTAVRIRDHLKSATDTFTLKTSQDVAVVHDEAANVNLAGEYCQFVRVFSALLESLRVRFIAGGVVTRWR